MKQYKLWFVQYASHLFYAAAVNVSMIERNNKSMKMPQNYFISLSWLLSLDN